MAANDYDLLILVDSTASMGTYLRSLNRSLRDITRISSLTGRFSRIGVMTYGDYCGGPLTQWSGWYSEGPDTEITQTALLDFVSVLRPDHGGDWPEATKTGLAHAYQVMRECATTIMLLYTDAPPHMPITGGDNHKAERRLLKTRGSFGDSAARFVDWASAAQTLRHGDKRAKVFCLVDPGSYAIIGTLTFYAFLSVATGGHAVHLNLGPSAEDISELTIGVLLAWMGVEKEGAKLNNRVLGKHVTYKDRRLIEQVKSETSEEAANFFPQLRGTKTEATAVKNNIQSTELTMENLHTLISDPEDKAATDFSKRYNSDPAYRESVTRKMEDLIEADVGAIGINPVFGSLWRAICSDRSNPMRDILITKFGAQVSKLVGPAKERMQTWLEESYDRVGEILDILETVPKDDLFPCVFLDPTLGFTQTSSSGEGNAEETLTRDELLEIGRSCDIRILRRLGRVLTRLTYVNSAAELPSHIKVMPLDKVPRIPMALAKPQLGRHFWKILLHAILPGTMLAGRPAALLAALSLRMGMKPLQEAAYLELLFWKDKWNTLEIPETWNTSCLDLLLDANQKSRLTYPSGIKPDKREPILHESDRLLFQTLVEYKLLEFNLKTTLTARAGWRPEKARMPLGPVVVCKGCKYPRSVTMMAEKGLCGMCEINDISDPEERDLWIHGNVSKEDNEATPATWVECSNAECRAQYVLYFSDKLNVRPKCHYCRQNGVVARNDPDRQRKTTAPCVECSVCLSRVIWPSQYRPEGFFESKYRCVGCTSGKCTVVNVETSAEKLLADDPAAVSCLLRNTDNKITKPFEGRSLFHVISTAGVEGFADKVEILPPLALQDMELRVKGKLIVNLPEMMDSLRKWVTTRRVEQGTCGLCFETFKKQALRPSCLRSGCLQMVCEGCLASWYGLNSRGQVINVAALGCPFCRRRPSAKVTIPSALKCLGGLNNAVEESGSWIYAWCSDCGLAKRYMERICAAGAPAVLNNWICPECDVVAQENGGGDKKKGAKPCPGCKVMTEKEYGCDHITCPVPNCGAHWCYNCGMQVEDEGQIYDHMRWAHDGLWGIDEDLDPDYDDVF